MKRKITYITLLLSLCFIIHTSGQEKLSNLQNNPALVKRSNQNNKSGSTLKSSKSVLELPFITDFAKSVGSPDTAFWKDNLAFENLTYPINPPGIGVISMDAIDGTGKIYSNASSTTFPADTLTSKTINLNYPGDNTIFISFYYEPGGLGDTPEKGDSLLLDFYASELNTWINVWAASYNSKDTILTENYRYADSTKVIEGDSLNDLKTIFQQVIIPVDDDNYLNSGFQFRFRNYASLTSADDVEGTSGNSDHWHLDFIILDKDRNANDTIISDVVIDKTMHSLIKGYESIPWHHFGPIYGDAMSDTISISYTNLSGNSQNLSSEFTIQDESELFFPQTIQGAQAIALEPFSNSYYSRFYDYIFPYDISIDSIVFKISAYIESVTPGNDLFNWNDTTTFYQKFYNYYAYDDGSSENGYGIIGEGTENAMVALRFDNYIADTLRGVQIYFNQIAETSTSRNFKIHVWDDNNGVPGNIIYTLDGLTVFTEQGINEFNLYKFDEIITVGDVFYVGWQKINSTDMLNVGYDVNRVNKDKLFYNFANEWKQSEFDGTVMIRPMLGKELNIVSSSGKNEMEELEFKIYPNPANEHLNIVFNDYYNTSYHYEIFDSFGRVHLSNYSNETSINISELSPGLYFIRISTSEGKSTSKKFIVLR